MILASIINQIRTIGVTSTDDIHGEMIEFYTAIFQGYAA